MQNAPPPQYQPDPAIQLQFDLHARVVDTLRGILPPPLEDMPEAWSLRDRLALSDVNCLLPANPVEARLAALHVAATEYARYCLLQAPLYVDDPKRWGQLMAQAASMGREARGYVNTLYRVQRVRQKREATEASRDAAAMAEHCTLGLMTQALERMPPGPPKRPAVQPAKAVAAAAPAPAAEKVHYRDYSEWSEEEKQADRLRAKADHYAIVNTVRVKEIRKLGRLPDNCDFEPPEPEVLHAIINGDTSNLRWADEYEPWVPPKT